MKKRGIYLAVLLCLIVLPCAAQVTLLTGQKDFYFRTAEDAALPLTLNNTYDHDVTGVLRYTLVAEKPGGNVTTVQEKTFTLFTGQRSYLLPVGRSEIPLILHYTVVFLYSENGGGRRASLEDIVVHFVKNQSEIRADRSPRESSDVPDPEPGSRGSMSGGSGASPNTDPLQKIQNNQVQQDVKSLQQQFQNEDAESLRQKKEFLSLLVQDPTFAAVNRSLVNDGFGLTGTEVSLLTNISGNFSASYEQKSRSAAVSGSLDEGRLLFADESSGSTIPLPDVLAGNATFITYERELVQNGFLRNATLMHYTPGGMTVYLGYGDIQNRFTHLRAAISNGTITSIEGEPLDEPSPYLLPFLSIVIICLLSGGIIFMSRRLPRSTPPKVEEPVPAVVQSAYRETVETMLVEAGAMAEEGRYPDAFARAGQALRFIISRTMSDGRELTNEEVAQMLSPQDTGTVQIIATLERCSMVAFAKGTPDPEEFKKILSFIRALLQEKEVKQ